ncbi:MAG TPA: DUF3800 domain-containing protein [Thermodesulfobacteriota bacterium]|nr:DUF3800 domain-containing protein [Thermodesulfobacteriota bacterium]
MGYLLFLDESGIDRRESPYEVLAGICVKDLNLWDLTCDIHDSEVDYFGKRITAGEMEFKGKKLLKKKTFRLASRSSLMEPQRRAQLAKQCLENRSGCTPEELTAFAQAKLAFTKQILMLCEKYSVKAFASIVDTAAPCPANNFLRKDYSFLFQRYYEFLRNQSTDELGIVVFDELERSQSHILINQMSIYFRETKRGIQRSSRIIPEPFFVHSHLTTAIQIADLIAYIISWGVRFGDNMIKPCRDELSDFADIVKRLRYRCLVTEENSEKEYERWSFKYIDDLRPRQDLDKLITF